MSKSRYNRRFPKTATANSNATVVSLKQRPQIQIRPSFPKNSDCKFKCNRRFFKTTTAKLDTTVVSQKQRM
ncbi:hypothetical protein [Ligilactobacillus pabuli]|uniref:hypothetical protein n=1 Tax=Ligilactobacillus pabuli TaxID=2886039 RepID=UPI001FBBF584|nr:hypothetical protein [Ligilactobacillus pabuli]